MSEKTERQISNWLRHLKFWRIITYILVALVILGNIAVML